MKLLINHIKNIIRTMNIEFFLQAKGLFNKYTLLFSALFTSIFFTIILSSTQIREIIFINAGLISFFIGIIVGFLSGLLSALLQLPKKQKIIADNMISAFEKALDQSMLNPIGK